MYVKTHSHILLCWQNDQKCETLELADYERCQDHKGFLKRKRHFNLIPSPQTKGQDLKFQARNVEERDSWIQALNEGINRGKNKIFDEVNVDSSCSLEHVTRDRAQRGAAKRRPPTRIHLKGVSEAAEDGSSRLDLEKVEGVGHMPLMSRSENTGASPEKERVSKPTTQPEPVREKKPVKIPVPPPKQGPVPEKEQTKIPILPPDQTSAPSSIGKPHLDKTDSVVPIIHPPSPPPKILKENIYAREKLLSEGGNTNPEVKSDLKTPVSGSRENLVDNNNPPQPPPKILSDKMKIKWEGSTSDLLGKDTIKPVDRGSKENLVEFDSDELGKTDLGSAVLSDEAEEPELNDDINSQQSNDQDIFDHLDEKTIEEIEESSENSETREMLDLSAVQEKAKEVAFEDSGCIQSMEEHFSEKQSTLMPINATSAKSTFPERIPRSSSLGDFLSEDSMGFESKCGHKKTIIHLTKDHLHQVEMKLACGREKTETLLNRVLQGELMKSPEGNGPKAETLLNEAVKQLKEASQVLQELQESSNISTDVAGAVTSKKRELVTLYRRSVP
ncbi:hypothetical protein XELAEV_18018421mg [Xenopus laevis]|uniref:PH domain-containing protein n=1 Tax=Xenopus laevis TaxID=8355 RepID=A0A974HTS2_XENLA|nr:hypothetical protein XELAEV_18018421mg [Xenopus laevis]